MVHGLDSPFPECPLEEAVEKHEAVEKEYYDEEKGCWLLLCVYPTEYRTDDGKPLYLHMASDITERKLMEEKLHKSEEKYRSLIENAPNSIVISTYDGRVVDVNKALLEMHGFDSLEEFNASAISDRYYNVEEREQWLKLAQEKGRIVNYEVQLKRKNGETFWASLNSRSLTTETGGQQFMTVLQDITERKIAQEALANEAIRRRILIEQSRDGKTTRP